MNSDSLDGNVVRWVVEVYELKLSELMRHNEGVIHNNFFKQFSRGLGR